MKQLHGQCTKINYEHQTEHMLYHRKQESQHCDTDSV